MSRIRSWIQASRPLAQANIAVPLLYGEALGYREAGQLAVGLLVAAHVFGVLDQLFIVFANDVADWQGDVQNTTFNTFSGGSRVIPDKLLGPFDLARAALVSVIAMAAVGAWLTLRADRPLSLILVGFAVLVLWAYSFAPVRLSYRGHGELLQGLGTGVVLPVFGWYLQTGDLEAVPWLALVPAFVLGYASNLTTALPDFPADQAVGKRTWAVRHGQRSARIASLVAIATAACLAPFVLAPDRQAPVLIASALTLALLAVNLGGLRGADAERRAACRRFVIVNGAAITVALAGWSIALFSS